MKNYWLLVPFVLAACGPIPQSPCINPGVDMLHPNFYVPHDYRALEAYYGCVYLNAGEIFADEPFYSAYYRQPDYLKQDSQYQWNLWRQLYTRTKPALEIERLWLDYYAAQSINRKQLDASERTAYVAESEAYEARKARYKNERNERKARKAAKKEPFQPIKINIPGPELKPYVPLVAPVEPIAPVTP